MKISTASLSLSLLTLALTFPLGGCYTYEEGGDPIAGSAPMDIVTEHLQDAYFLVTYPDGGPSREVITYAPDSGKICMAVRETLTPLSDGSGDPAPSDDGTVDDGGWVILTARVDYESTSEDRPYLLGPVYWYDVDDLWREYGDFDYYGGELASSLQLTLAIWPTTTLEQVPINITAIRGALPGCEPLHYPDVSPTPKPEPTELPQPTPI